MRDLPEAVKACAYKASNGEYAWTRSHVGSALQAIAATAQATLGGEVWAVGPEGIWGAIPTARGGLASWQLACLLPG
jgi:hypothetical protein